MQGNLPNELQDANQEPESQLRAIRAYAADLEIEVDRLRRRDQFWQRESRERIQRIARICQDSSRRSDSGAALKTIGEACDQFRALLDDLTPAANYLPAFDQVVDIELRPMVEQIFREQQRLSRVGAAVLRFELETERVNWFPARLHHVLDNLISNALRFCDPSRGEIRVGLAVRSLADGYELQLSDNGVGIPADQLDGMLELTYRADPARVEGLGVGLAAVKRLVEHCCGSITFQSGIDKGTTVTIRLPRYAVDDHVD